MNDEGYNGWSNRATWNVAMWVRDDFGIDSRWARDRKVTDGKSLRNCLENIIEELGLREYFLVNSEGVPTHFVTPDAERFDDANWDELFDSLIGSDDNAAKPQGD